MKLHNLSNCLTEKFSLYNPQYSLDEDIVCQTYNFESDLSFDFPMCKVCSIYGQDTALESGERENQKFRYALFAPSHRERFSEAIVLLHGLNERDWAKYLPWAYSLALQTQKPVIMFPIAYHINRSPQTWTTPRLMNQLSNNRRAMLPEMSNSSFANVALSIRLDFSPELFLLSGIQTFFDVINLCAKIKEGHFPIFDEGSKIDFFAYSIGALLTEVLLISNPQQLFTGSRAFLFCGGSTFDKINGSSRSIMDSKAFSRLQDYMIHNTSIPDKVKKLPQKHTPFLDEGWKALLVMSGIQEYADQRENAFKNLENRVQAIGLLGDEVVPGEAIRETFAQSSCCNVDVLDFPFSYSHAAPFPMRTQKQSDSVSVDRSFYQVFDKASTFLV